MTPPVVRITGPAAGARVTEPAPVTAEIAVPAGQRIATWCAHYVADGARPRELACGTGAPPATLAEFDPTLLQNGVYTLRVTATATGGDPGHGSIGPHYDYEKRRVKGKWRIYPDGRIERKKGT